MKINELMTPADASMQGQQIGQQPMGQMGQQPVDPKTQTALNSQYQKNKLDQRKQIQDRITMITKELADLRKQLSSIR